MASSSTILGAVILSICVASNLSGQNNCRERTVPVAVTDANGVAIESLTSRDFKVTYRGRLLNIVAADHTQAPRRVVILLDVSASMNRVWAEAIIAAKDLIAATDFRTQIALMTFSDKVQNRIDFFAGRQAVVRWLGSSAAESPKVPQRKTAFYDTIAEAINLLQPAQPGDSIIAITDGNDNASHTSAQKTTLTLESAGVRMMGLSLNPPLYFAPKPDPRQESFDLASDSGGTMFSLRPTETSAESSAPRLGHDEASLAKLKSATAAIEAAISEPYFLTVEVPESPTKPAGWRIEVVDVYGRSKKGVLVFYPRELLPCSATAAAH